MCTAGAMPKPEDPEITLSNLILKETGATIKPKMVRLFILANWDKVALYAHLIHRNK